MQHRCMVFAEFYRGRLATGDINYTKDQVEIQHMQCRVNAIT